MRVEKTNRWGGEKVVASTSPLTKGKKRKRDRCASTCGQFVNVPQSTCPYRSNIQYLYQTRQCASGMVTNVDSYSLYACSYMLPAWETFRRKYATARSYLLQWQMTAVSRKTNNIFAASGFHKIPRIIYCACAITTMRYWKITRIYAVCFQFKHYVGLVNLPHSPSCPMFPYIHNMTVDASLSILLGGL